MHAKIVELVTGIAMVAVWCAPAGAQAPLAERIGPGSGKPSDAVRPLSAVDKLQVQLYREVDYPLQLLRLDHAIQRAEAQLDSLEERAEQYEQLNAQVPPNAFTPSDIIPPPPNYDPDTAPPAIQPFSPSSSFAHVAEKLTQQYEDAERQLDVLRQQRRAIEKLHQDPRRVQALAAQAATLREDYAERLERLADEIELAEFRVESFDRRIDQYTELKQQTFSTSYSDLWQKLQLGSLEANQRLEYLQKESDLLEAHLDAQQQLAELTPAP